MIDSHIHLNHEDYREDLEAVIKSAKESGVEQVIMIGCDESGIHRALEINEQFQDDFFKLAFGWHPVDVSDFTEEMYQLIKDKTITTNNAVAIGEIGLDYHWYPEQKEAQKELFIRQIELAKELDLPIIVHAREAYEDCLEILSKYAPITGVMHSFADTPVMAQKFVDLGMKIGISGPITFKNGQSQKDVAKAIDLQHLLIETDGPYLTPTPYRGKRNLPQYIEYVAEEIAFQKGISKDIVLAQTAINTKELFGGKNV